MSAPRVQFVISGKFIGLFVVAVAMLGGGYYWYIRQQQTLEEVSKIQSRFKTPPYYINRGATTIRDCSQCIAATGQLKPVGRWKLGVVQQIPETEHRWFLAVEDPPLPVTIAGVLMLPVHPAYKEDPSFGFDESKVLLALFQNLQQKSQIEHPQSPPVIPPDQSVVESRSSEPPPKSTGLPAVNELVPERFISGLYQAVLLGRNGNTLALTIDLKNDGRGLAGSISWPGTTSPISNGEIAGDTISFDQKMTYNPQLVIHYVGQIEGDTIKFTRTTKTPDGQELKTQFIAKKQ